MFLSIFYILILILYFNSDFILSDIVIVSSYAIVQSRAFLSWVPTHGLFVLSPVSLATRDQEGGPSNTTIDIYDLTEKKGTVNTLLGEGPGVQPYYCGQNKEEMTEARKKASRASKIPPSPTPLAQGLDLPLQNKSTLPYFPLGRQW